MLSHRVVHTAVAAVCWSTDSRCSTNAAGVFPDLVYRSPSLLLSPVYISERGRGEKYKKKKKNLLFFLFYSSSHLFVCQSIGVVVVVVYLCYTYCNNARSVRTISRWCARDEHTALRAHVHYCPQRLSYKIYTELYVIY